MEEPQVEQRKILTSISCAKNNQFCIAIGEDKSKPITYTSTDGGENWVFHAYSQFQINDVLYSAICTGDKGENCIAVGRVDMKAATLTSTGAGLHWTPQLINKLQ